MTAPFFFFSDDPAWVTEHLLPTLPSGSVAVASLASVEDFVLMSSCHGNIICNSGFSWTAAWLNDASNRLAVSPSRWLKDEALNAQAMKALYQPDWVYL